jgi:hypothetical protein
MRIARTLRLQIFRYRRKLFQSRFQFLGYLQREYIRIREVLALSSSDSSFSQNTPKLTLSGRPKRWA